MEEYSAAGYPHSGHAYSGDLDSYLGTTTTPIGITSLDYKMEHLGALQALSCNTVDSVSCWPELTEPGTRSDASREAQAKEPLCNPISRISRNHSTISGGDASLFKATRVGIHLAPGGLRGLARPRAAGEPRF